MRPCRRTASVDAVEIPSTYVPARNTVFLSLALAWAEVLGALRHLHRRQRARLLRISGLPARLPRGVRAPGGAGYPRRRRRDALPRPRPAAAHDQGRDHPRGPGLGLDYGLTHSCYDPAPTAARADAATAACSAPKDLRRRGHRIRWACNAQCTTHDADEQKPEAPAFWSGGLVERCASLRPASRLCIVHRASHHQ